MVGKTNMDQFAAGLVGTRTPYGTATCAFDSRFVPGGSSSGSGSAVGAQIVTFALGTDTAGSGANTPAGVCFRFRCNVATQSIKVVNLTARPHQLTWRHAGFATAKFIGCALLTVACLLLSQRSLVACLPNPGTLTNRSKSCSNTFAGRIPAMFNGCVGIKPTVGRLSTRGVVPACKSLDCVSVFAQSVEDGAAIARIMEVRNHA